MGVLGLVPGAILGVVFRRADEGYVIALFTGALGGFVVLGFLGWLFGFVFGAIRGIVSVKNEKLSEKVGE